MERPKVLLIEDDEINLFVFERMLRKAFHVEVARNGLEALHKTAKRVYDVILMDIHLGDHSLDGVELLEEIRKDSAHEDTKIFAITSYALPKDDEYYLSLGFDHYFAKPVDNYALIDSIKEVCVSSLF